MNKKIKKFFILQICLLVVLFVFISFPSKQAQFIDNKIQDLYTKLNTDNSFFGKYFMSADKNIIIINIDDIAQFEISKLSPVNLNRKSWAKIINTVEKNAPNVLVLDLLFEGYEDNSLGIASNDNTFANTLKNYNNIVISTKLSSQLGELATNKDFQADDEIKADFEIPSNQFKIFNNDDEIHKSITYYKHSKIPYIFTSNSTLSVNNIQKESDGIVRKFEPIYRIIEKSDEIYLPSTALIAALKYIDYKNELTIHNQKIISQNFVLPIDKSAQMYINWHDKYCAYETIPLSALIIAMKNNSNIIEYEDKQIPLSYFKNKIIIFGKSSNNELYKTPLAQNITNAEITATITDNIINDIIKKDNTTRKILRELPEFINVIFILCVTVFTFLIFSKIKNIVLSVFLLTFFIVSYIAFTIIAYSYPDIRVILPVIQPILSMLLVYWIFSLSKFIKLQKRKLRLNSVLAKSVPKSTLRKIVNNPDYLKLEAQKQEVTIMECTILNFMDYAKIYDTQIMIKKINELFNMITTCAFKYDGKINNISGDKIIIYWEKENADINAIKCAIEINENIFLEKIMLDEKNYLELNIAINTDTAILGCVGKNNISTYTIMGTCIDNIYQLSKIASQIGIKIVISERTYEKTKYAIQANYKGEVKLSSNSKKIKIYEPVAILQK